MSAKLTATSNNSLALSTQPVSIRYPVAITFSEEPHRFFVHLEYIRQIWRLIICAAFLELFFFMCVPGSNPIYATCFGSFCLLIVGLRITSRNTRVKMTDDSITFPSMSSLNGRKKRSWSDVALVDLHVAKNGLNLVRGNILTISFKSGGYADLHIARMSHKDVTALSCKLLEHVDAGAFSPAFSELITRNEFETSDTRGFVFAKEHRNLLDQNFGLANAEPHLPGTSIFEGQYIVEKLLSTGGIRAVYLVSDVQRGQTLRMSEYSLSVINDENRKRCIDALLAKSSQYVNLRIPHIYNLVEVKYACDLFVMFLEPEGKSLRSAVYKKTLGERNALSLALKLATAVGQIFKSGLVCGGIKPDAITYGADGTTMIGEFGFADDLIADYSNFILQDAPYSAPERLAGNTSIESDLYSIGAVMYFALTGIDPSSLGCSSVRMLNPKVSESTDRLIAKLMSPEPEDRGSIAELIDALGGTSAEVQLAVASDG